MDAGDRFALHPLNIGQCEAATFEQRPWRKQKSWWVRMVPTITKVRSSAIDCAKEGAKAPITNLITGAE